MDNAELSAKKIYDHLSINLLLKKGLAVNSLWRALRWAESAPAALLAAKFASCVLAHMCFFYLSHDIIVRGLSFFTLANGSCSEPGIICEPYFVVRSPFFETASQFADDGLYATDPTLSFASTGCHKVKLAIFDCYNTSLPWPRIGIDDKINAEAVGRIKVNAGTLQKLRWP